jgi:hypothetical protein
MLKWWGGWSEREGCDVIMKYLLDSVYNVEDEILADAMAPDRARNMNGCPTTWLTSTHEQLKELVPTEEERQHGFTMASVFQASLDDMEKRLTQCIHSCFNTKNDVPEVAIQETTPAPTTTVVIEPGHIYSQRQPSIVPSAANWKQFLSYYFIPNPAKHLYIPVKDFMQHDVAVNKAPTVSKCKTLGKNFLNFTSVFLGSMPFSLTYFDDLLSKFEKLLQVQAGAEVKSIDGSIAASKLLLKSISDKSPSIMTVLEQEVTTCCYTQWNAPVNDVTLNTNMDVVTSCIGMSTGITSCGFNWPEFQRPSTHRRKKQKTKHTI